jgi:2-polyprenyl-3-methyl-5-hydroxy-6-metoxy-1,4-benzoquinol methylase
VVLPSVSEGFPFVLLEALALAKPVIASNVHAVYELIEDRKNGVLVPARDARALAEGIRLVLRDPARAAEMGRQGRQAVQDRFTVEQMVGQTVALFEAALRGERTSPAEDKQAAGTSSWAGSLHSIGCPCGSPLPARLVFRTATRRYVRCPACRLVFLSPRPPADTIQQFYREEYDRTYGRVESGPGRISVFRSVSRHLGRYRKPPGRLLDVGCGDGHFLELCRESGWTTYGLELSRAATERGLRRGLTMLPHDWLDKAARTGTEESEKDRFDVITLINVLETVPDPAAMLQSVRQALAPGGILLVRVGNGGFHLFLRRPVRWLGGRYQQAFHLFVYPPEALLHLLRDAGFAPLSVRNSRPSTAPLSGGERRMRRALWQATGEAFWALAQGAFWLTGRRAIWAPSFELIARAK